MNETGNIFYSKLLLFGEYAILAGSMALSVPFKRFSGRFEFSSSETEDIQTAQRSNENIRRFLPHLKELNKDRKTRFKTDIKKLESDLNEGLYFNSNIPQAYGVGSSGALCAAIFDRYSNIAMLPIYEFGSSLLVELKDFFAKMESFFHGTSSGYDPLNCYLKSPLLIENQQIKMLNDNSLMEHEALDLFLVDSGQHSSTGNPMKFFQSQYKTEAFRKIFHDMLIISSNECINSLLNRNYASFWRAMKDLSGFQLDNLGSMIPDDFKPIWREGLKTDQYYLKLCGSGGGGYIMGFTQNIDLVADMFPSGVLKYQ